MRTIWISLIVTGFVGIGGGAYAQCPVNSAGGPNELVLTTDGPGSDLDLGWMGDSYHNLKVPNGSQMRVCLQDCDTTTNPACTADGAAAFVLNDAFTPPVPVYAGSVPACVLVRFKTPPGGTANVETGVIDLHLGLTAQAYAFTPIGTICPRCSGATVGASGTCDSGARSGLACVTEDIETVIGLPTGSVDYPVSRDCLPSGAPSGAVDILNIPFTTNTSTLTGSLPCAGQAHDDNCGTSGPCTSTSCSGKALRGGVPQYCCAGKTSRPCFPTGTGSIGKIERDGTTAAATPLWPDTSYAKQGNARVVTSFCSTATGNPLVDPSVGLPGPIALILPLIHEWKKGAAPPTTTTTTVTTTSTSTSLPSTTSTTGPTPTTTSTTLPGPTTTTAPTPTTTSTTLPSQCASPADCNDNDPCTDDQCNANVCAHPPVANIDCANANLGALTGSQLCGSETINAKLLAKINAAVTKAQNFLAKAKAATKPKKAARFVAKAAAAIQALEKKVTKAVSAKKNSITQGCALSINGAAEKARVVIADIQS